MGRAVAEPAEAKGHITRSRTSGVKQAEAKTEAALLQKALSFLEAPSFTEAHLAAFYRLSATDLCGPRVFLREKGDAGDEAFPNPFVAVDLNDKRGLWQGEPLHKSLGENPAELGRKKNSDGSWQPVGLKNLGATCYLNSLLQYLFFNLDFRHHLLHASSSSSVVAALQRVFTLLAEGEQCTVDTSDFVKAAGVDAVAQQDATEFSAILLEWLQRELGHCERKAAEPHGGAFIPALFEGELLQLIQCSKNPAHSSERRESFMELRARLSPEGSDDASLLKRNKKRSVGSKTSKGPQTVVRLEQVLEDTTLVDEMLDGSNQWHCESCDCKVDARKTIRIAKLPPYLHVIIERYHYDRRTFERKRLGHTVNFPRRLELQERAPAKESSEAMDVSSETTASSSSTAKASSDVCVTYECIGALEHVSDSAHSGHYRATLLQEDADSLRERTEVSAEGPPAKRPRCDGADVAAGMPRQATWWTMDDDTVTPATWGQPDASDAAEGATSQPSTAQGTPDRIESATAYLLLYRRLDHQPGQLATSPGNSGVSEKLATFVGEANSDFAAKLADYAKKAESLQSFVAERKLAINGLIEALRNKSAEAVTGGPENFSFVPSAWLLQFLRGEDQPLEELTPGPMSVAPVVYGPSILHSRTTCGQAVDPLAVWCGDVKLLPTAVLANACGNGSLHNLLFLAAKESLDAEACKAALVLFKAWSREQQLVAQLMKDSRLSQAEARSLESQGKASEAVWIANRLNKVWGKMAVVGVGCSERGTLLRARWQAFLEEMSSYRSLRFREPVTFVPDEAAEDAEDGKEPDVAGRIAEVSLQGPLLCTHHLVCRPRSGFLAKRAEVEAVIQAAACKEEAFRALFKEARLCDTPRLRAGPPSGTLCCFSDVCVECKGIEVASSAASGTATASTKGKRVLTVKRRFKTQVRKLPGSLLVTLPPDGQPVTAAAVLAAIRELYKFQVARLWVLGAAGGETELSLATGVLGGDVDTIIVEKDEVEREAAAFEGTIFRVGARTSEAAATILDVDPDPEDPDVDVDPSPEDQELQGMAPAEEDGDKDGGEEDHADDTLGETDDANMPDEPEDQVPDDQGITVENQTISEQPGMSSAQDSTASCA